MHLPSLGPILRYNWSWKSEWKQVTPHLVWMCFYYVLLRTGKLKHDEKTGTREPEESLQGDQMATAFHLFPAILQRKKRRSTTFTLQFSQVLLLPKNIAIWLLIHSDFPLQYINHNMLIIGRNSTNWPFRIPPEYKPSNIWLKTVHNLPFLKILSFILNFLFITRATFH